MVKSQIPISKQINDFLDWIDIEKGLSSKTQENYERFLDRFLFWLKKEDLNGLLPHQLTPDHVWSYRLFLSRQFTTHKGESLKKTTQNYYLIALRALLRYFVAKDIISLPPDKITLPKPDKEKSVNFLTPEQISKLFSATDISNITGLRDRAILETFFSTGMRISELTSLNKEQIKIKSGMTDIELGIVGKGGRARTVYFSKTAIDWLGKYLDTRKDDDEKALFINYSGRKDASRRLTPRAIENAIKKYTIMAGLPITTTPHVLRHSFATDLLVQGVDLRTVQEFLGHKNILATQIYTHITNKRLRDIHRKFHGEKNDKDANLKE
ncbi:MAG: tyrosine-type recombinase/integrase [Candidatus Staskawiczbacteria bacterium]|nr:tyrosine-type recombinase/integrase [Candidatus Staskawiczbacteria bacterium]